MVAAPMPAATTVGSEDRELASKLVRALRYAAEMEPKQLIDILDQLGPPCESPQWDETYAWLLRTRDDAEIIARLTERYQDPGVHLIALLNEVAPPGVEWDDLGRDYDDPSCVHRRAYRLLFEIGTRASLTWVLSRLDLFNYEPEREYEEPIGKHSASIQAVALELWPAFSWEKRADIVLLLCTHHLLDHRFMELLLSIDIQALPSSDRADYLDALGNCYDDRLLPRIQGLFERVLDDLSQPVTAHDRRTVDRAMWQYAKLDTPLPTAIRERVEALGVRRGPGMVRRVERR